MEVQSLDVYDRVMLKDTNGKVFRALVVSFSGNTFRAEWVVKDYDYTNMKDTVADRSESFDVITGKAIGDSGLEWVGKP